MLEEDLRLHAGLASPVDDTQDYAARTSSCYFYIELRSIASVAQELPPPLLRIPCPGHKLELGYFVSAVTHDADLFCAERSRRR